MAKKKTSQKNCDAISLAEAFVQEEEDEEDGRLRSQWHSNIVACKAGIESLFFRHQGCRKSGCGLARVSKEATMHEVDSGNDIESCVGG
jgi:hypothetical protein